MAQGYIDRYGLTLTTNSSFAAQRYVEGMDLLLSYNLGLDRKFAEAVAADEGFALAHAALAVVYQLRGNLTEAKACAARAQSLAEGVSRRERQHVAIIATIMAGEGARALELIREHLQEFPRDALLLFQANMLLMYSGLKDRREQALALLESCCSAYGEDWWFLGSLSFVKHELDQFEESRRLSERSLQLYPRNANAAHNLAHVFHETVDLTGGLDFIQGWLADYEPEAPFYCHLTWHQAIFELSQGRYEQALALFDRGIRDNVMSRSALPDAAALLWRCKIYGYDKKPLPWEAARELVQRIAPKPGFAFNDAHTALVFAALEDEETTRMLLNSLRELAAQGNMMAGTVTLPLAEGISAFGQGDYEETIRQMEPLTDELIQLGGSHAQREIFEDTLLLAYMRSGHYDRAERLLQRRLSRRSWPRDLLWLGQVQNRIGDSAAARSTLKEARQYWGKADKAAPEMVFFSSYVK